MYQQEKIGANCSVAVWRRFLPKRKVNKAASTSHGDPFSQIREQLAALHHLSLDQLNQEIATRRENAETALDWLTLLILQAPRAAIAQESMDKHPHGYRNRDKRLYELIDFNNAFVTTVLLLPEEELTTFVSKLKVEIAQFCHQLHTKSFTDEQYEAITHGLSREIAVYAAAKKHGFEVIMTSRAADAFGIDMQIRDRGSSKYINVDCKTGSAFHFRLKDLIHEGRLAPHDMADAETKGWWQITNREESVHVKIILLRVDQDELGPIIAFRFKDESVLIHRLHGIIERYGLSDNRFDQLT